jgi:lipopolysaccharide assembly protein A
LDAGSAVDVDAVALGGANIDAAGWPAASTPGRCQPRARGADTLKCEFETRFKLCRFSGLEEGGEPMRWIYLAFIVLFAVATLIFALQNLDAVTMSFLGFKVRAPLALLTIVVYLLGAATGGSLLALLRRSYEGSRRSVVGSA